jgi:DNA-binding LacI/PurR family transcriptional regulator
MANRVTSQDVADAAGVSRTTVSLVLNKVKGAQISEETRRRVVESAKRLGYVPNAAARALASRRAQIFGLLLTRQPHHIASDMFISQILDGLIEIVRKNDMRLLIDIVQPEHQEVAYLDLVRAKRIDGLILSGPRSDDKALHVLVQEGFPTVLIGQLPGTDFYSVDVDNRGAAQTAVNHLISLGRDRIACITNAQPSYTASVERLWGYRDALMAAGIPFDEKLVRYGDYDLESGFNQMDDLLSNHVRFDAAFVASDTVALGAIAAIHKHGLRVPDDIALVGFDDVPLARYASPPLTTIHLPALELSRLAAETLIKLLRGIKIKQKQVILETHLVIRESCGAGTLPGII